jgi:hypothetical protein
VKPRLRPDQITATLARYRLAPTTELLGIVRVEDEYRINTRSQVLIVPRDILAQPGPARPETRSGLLFAYPET